MNKTILERSSDLEPSRFLRRAALAAVIGLFASISGAQDSLHVTSSGDVGVGTDSPTAKFHVLLDGVPFALHPATAMAFQNNGDPNAGVIFSLIGGTGASSNGQINFGNSTNEFAGRIVFSFGANAMRFFVGGEKARIDSEGDLGIGTTSPATPLHVSRSTAGTILRIQNSSATCDFTPAPQAESVIACSSDARLKTNVRPLSTAEALADLIRVPLFEYELVSSPGTTLAGPVAQELAKTHPELVSEAEDGMLMSALPGRTQLIAAIQELQKSVVSLQTRLEELETRRSDR